MSLENDILATGDLNVNGKNHVSKICTIFMLAKTNYPTDGSRSTDK